VYPLRRFRLKGNMQIASLIFLNHAEPHRFDGLEAVRSGYGGALVERQEPGFCTVTCSITTGF
jgi:hypothetical protein